MRIGLKINQHHLSWAELLSRVRHAEANGFDGVWLFDHFKPQGGDPSGPCMEGWTLLAALAASTERIRMGMLVTGVTYRHPSILAAQAVTVDHVSSGRLELALGAAWEEQEHRELGIGFPSNKERTERLEEAVQVVRLLMTRDEVSFRGRHYQLAGATYRPRPVQRPHPPIWIGANGEHVTIPIAAREADVWHCFGSFDELPRKVRVLDGHAERAGREPSSIVKATSMPISGPAQEVAQRAEAIRDLGFSYLVVEWPPQGLYQLDPFIKNVMPGLQQ